MWHNTWNPTDKRILNNATAELKQRIAQFRNATFRSFTQDINNISADYIIQEAVKSLKQATKVEHSYQNWCISDITKSEAFDSHLESTFTTKCRNE